MSDDAAAYQLFDTPEGVRGRYTRVPLSELGEGDALLRVTHSSVNYKDGLAATGRATIARSLPMIGGCCAVGVVLEPGQSGLEVGAPVSIVGATLSEQHNGGYCEYLRVPSSWLTPVPPVFSLFDAAAIGTAGVTAAMAVLKLEQAGVNQAAGPVAVTGASGGSGSIAVAILAERGYDVTAFTGRREAADYLVSLGAARVEARPDTSGKRPLEKGQWAGAVDTVGGSTLAWLTRTAAPGASIAAFGNAGGNTLNATVLPFILRGINLLGVTVTFPSDAVRTRTWNLLEESLRPEALHAIASEIAFDELDSALVSIVEEGIRGRVVVRIAEREADAPAAPDPLLR